MSQERERLPNCRAAETLQFDHGGFRYVASIGRFVDGRLAEVFLSGPKVGTDVAFAARDASIMCSIGLQYGVPVEPSGTPSPETVTAAPRVPWADCSTFWRRKARHETPSARAAGPEVNHGSLRNSSYAEQHALAYAEWRVPVESGISSYGRPWY
jgi:hypothetical protein